MKRQKNILRNQRNNHSQYLIINHAVTNSFIYRWDNRSHPLDCRNYSFTNFCIFHCIKCFLQKIPQGKAIVRTGIGGTNVAFNKGMYVIPVFHKMEIMDISVKKIEISRMQHDGLICKDNIRADIKVAFFVRVNKSVDDVISVAQFRM
ncbi:SPFH domain-containing protein [Sphingobacterium sp. IITKGP-BTPF85]|uniref:SPFH domain-containing protein n=1 Tax=Sphingobacterium sp. IITKGP-BTPF85 TaxID=1338009 RepID=UPI0029349B16|nr:SPFH domain-containing protein [Sphingobacterium sp. IITKGP-BTPF85]